MRCSFDSSDGKERQNYLCRVSKKLLNSSVLRLLPPRHVSGQGSKDMLATNGGRKDSLCFNCRPFPTAFLTNFSCKSSLSQRPISLDDPRRLGEHRVALPFLHDPAAPDPCSSRSQQAPNTVPTLVFEHVPNAVPDSS